MVLSTVIPGKMYFQITLEDIPDGWILGGCCLPCGHTWPVDLDYMRRIYPPGEQLRHIDGLLKCRMCGTSGPHHFTIYGRRVRRAPVPIAGVVDGRPPLEQEVLQDLRNRANTG